MSSRRDMAERASTPTKSPNKTAQTRESSKSSSAAASADARDDGGGTSKQQHRSTSSSRPSSRNDARRHRPSARTSSSGKPSSSARKSSTSPPSSKAKSSKSPGRSKQTPPSKKERERETSERSSSVGRSKGRHSSRRFKESFNSAKESFTDEETDDDGSYSDESSYDSEEETRDGASYDSEEETRDGDDTAFSHSYSTSYEDTVDETAAHLARMETIERQKKKEKEKVRRAIVTKPEAEGPTVREKLTAPVVAAEAALRGFIEPAVSEAEASNPSTNTAVKNSVRDFVVQNVENQLVIQNAQFGNVEKLNLQELRYVPTPQKPTDVVLKVDCSTITLQDCMVRRGKWHEKQPLPFVPGTDVVGTVHSVGSAAASGSTFVVGDRVYAVVPSGGNAKYVSVPFMQLVRVPRETDPLVALCLASTYSPALQAFDLARKMNTPFTGANILVIGGNGPAGLATLELALYEGANVHATSSGRHHEFLRGMGVTPHPIEPEKWLPDLRGKMDVVFDSVCVDDYQSSNAALNSGGTLICTGMSAVYTRGKISVLGGWYDARDLKASACRFRAMHMMENTVFYDKVERYREAPNEFAQQFRFLCHLHAKGIVKPTVSSTAALKMVPCVQRSIEVGDVPYGVSVCTPWATNESDGAAAAEDADVNGKKKVEEEKKE